jgi:hypothetical protein
MHKKNIQSDNNGESHFENIEVPFYLCRLKAIAVSHAKKQ